MKDLHSGIHAATMIGAAALDADNSPVAVDLQGYNSAEIVLAVGVGGITFTSTHKVEFKLTHSDDDATYAAVADGDILGATVATGGIIAALTAAHAAAKTYRYGYVGGKRYLKLLADFSGTHGTATPMAAVALLGNPGDAPVADQAI